MVFITKVVLRCARLCLAKGENVKDAETEINIEQIRDWGAQVRESVERVFLGKSEVIVKMLVALLCKGHVLLEDVPGVGKTVLANALSRSLGGAFGRIQCTPDLLPTDITGVTVYNPKDGSFNFKQGPIHSNIILVDEINRATPRTQSALLESMAEAQVTVEGKSMALPVPFFLIATENPIEFEGTFPLPEAQKDRFFISLRIGYPSFDTELDIIENQRRAGHPVFDVEPAVSLDEILKHQNTIHQVFVHQEIRKYLLTMVDRSRKESTFRLGISPRGSLALFRGAQAYAALMGRSYVIPDDVKDLFIPVCEKRVIIHPEQVYKGITAQMALKNICDSVDVPPMEGGAKGARPADA